MTRGLAGIALGVWRSSADFLGGRRFERFEPATTATERRALAAGWSRAVAAALSWARAAHGSEGG